jgi:ribonuclease P protein component
MLQKINRLKKEKDFRKVLRSKNSQKEGFLLLKWVQNNSARSRIGISVSKKISKKATRRNRIKRQLAALSRLKLPKIKSGLDIFLVVLPGIEDKNFSEIDLMYNKLFSRAGIFSND